MIKGIKNQKLKQNLRYDQELVVPIIENTPFEEDLRDRMAQVIEEYPETCAILVRRHGVCIVHEYLCFKRYRICIIGSQKFNRATNKTSRKI